MTSDSNGKFRTFVTVPPSWPEGDYFIVTEGASQIWGEFCQSHERQRVERPLADARGSEVCYLCPQIWDAPVTDWNYTDWDNDGNNEASLGTFAAFVAANPRLIVAGRPQLETVYLPASEFFMGSDEAQIQATVEECNATEGNCRADWFASEKPLRSVWVDAFVIGTYEVTNSEYNQCVAAGVCAPAGHDIADNNIAYDRGFFDEKRPVSAVNWNDALTFCEWVGGRLPTEKEWEKAARGDDVRRYPWGNENDGYHANLGSGYPSDVAMYPQGASPYGVMDMAGNVFEWTATADRDRYVLRGGSWISYPFRGRVTDRGTKLEPEFANYDVGFRCAFD